MSELIYIAGYGRSGSTALDTLLGNHPTVFGAGELTHLFDGWRAGRACACGAAYPDCPFWREVMGQLEAALPGLELATVQGVNRRVESVLSPPLLLADRRLTSLYRDVWTTTLRAIRRVSGKEIIVDSSKSARTSAWRARALVTWCGVDLKVIHLVRDPRAVMWSILRGSNRGLEMGQDAELPGGAYRALFSWSWVNGLVDWSSARRFRSDLLRLRYEDIFSRPLQGLRLLGAFVDLDMQPLIDRVVSGEELDPGHGVGGNRTRRQGPLRLSYDEEWKERLPAYTRRLAWLSWPLAHRYGYDVLRLPERERCG